jgi:hypothetical protein
MLAMSRVNDRRAALGGSMGVARSSTKEYYIGVEQLQRACHHRPTCGYNARECANEETNQKVLCLQLEVLDQHVVSPTDARPSVTIETSRTTQFLMESLTILSFSAHRSKIAAFARHGWRWGGLR